LLPDRLEVLRRLVLFPPAELAVAARRIAWRASLWDGETLLAEQKSFLW